MKKLYTTPQYKRYHKRKLKRSIKKITKRNRITFIQKCEKKRKRDPYLDFHNPPKNRSVYNYEPLPNYAPSDFRLIENTEKCLQFFRDIRNHQNVFKYGKQKLIIMSLVDVKEIDYAAISVLTAISDDLRSQKIILRGDFPKDEICRKYIIDSGFLNHMIDANNKKFAYMGKSKMIFFEKGSGKLSTAESKRISEMIRDVVEHLTGKKKLIKPIKSILLEICGNSIEHADTKNKLWLLGIKYLEKKVIFTVIDVGKGILETLYKKHWDTFRDLLTMNSRDNILMGAFNQKYGSSTQEENRNKGLPSIKLNSELGIIKNLIVLTNDVILHFDSAENSRVLQSGLPRFKGTLYQWEITEECIINSINYNNGNN